MRALVGAHLVALPALALAPLAWPWLAAGLTAAHLGLFAAGHRPGSGLLGPSIARLPADRAARGEVALTFDDGPDPAITPRVLDLLDAHGARATFFLVGARAAAAPALVRELLARGHAVGNHSHTHPAGFAALATAGLRREVATAQDALRDLGADPTLFRAPLGLRSPLLDAVLRQHGLIHAGWSRRGLDGLSGDRCAVLARLRRGLQAGDVLLLHDFGRPVVLDVLPALLADLSARGLRAAPLNAVDAWPATGLEDAPRIPASGVRACPSAAGCPAHSGSG